MGRSAVWARVASIVAGTAAAVSLVSASNIGEPMTPSAIADAVLLSLNESVDPCVDAYEWACGGWRAASPPPPSEGLTSTFIVVDDRVSAAVDALLRAPAMASSQAGTFYASCMDASRRPAQDVAPLARFRPALTALTGANASVAAAAGALSTLAAAGVDAAVLEFDESAHPDAPGTNILWATVPEFTAAEAAFTGTTAYDAAVRAAYKKMLVSLAGTALDAGLLGEAPYGRPSAGAVADAAAAFEAQLITFSGDTPPTAAAVRAGIVRPPPRRGNQFVSSDASVRNESSPIALALELVASAVEGVGVTLPDSVYIWAPGEYIGALQTWLRAAVTPNGGGLNPLQAYLAVTATRTYAALDLLGSAPRAAVEAFTAAVSGATAPPPRLLRCVRRTGGLFPTQVGQAFAAAHLPAKEKAFAETMAKDVRAAFDRLISGADWLDASTLAAARAKLAGMRLLMGEVTPAAGPEDLSDVVVSADDYPASFLSANARRWRDLWTRAAAPPDRSALLQPITVNAFYMPFSNLALLTPGACARPAYFFLYLPGLSSVLLGVG